MLVLVDYLQQLLFVDGEDSGLVARLVSELDIFNVKGSNFKFHSRFTP